MNSQNRTVLYLDLRRRTYEVKVHAGMHEYIGGLGVALKILTDSKERDPVIFSVGPLNSSFPFASKILGLFYDDAGGLVESYGGGHLGLVLSLTAFESIVIVGRSPKPLFVNIASDKVEFIDDPEREWEKVGFFHRGSRVSFAGDGAVIDNYFHLDRRLGSRLSRANLRALVVNSDRSVKIEKTADYQRVYQEILLRGRELNVPFDRYFACGGCPAGCSGSAEAGFNPILGLSYCLIACGFAENIYEDIPTVFSCLNALGFDYSHETLEDVSRKITQMRKANGLL